MSHWTYFVRSLPSLKKWISSLFRYSNWLALFVTITVFYSSPRRSVSLSPLLSSAIRHAGVSLCHHYCLLLFATQECLFVTITVCCYSPRRSVSSYIIFHCSSRAHSVFFRVCVLWSWCWRVANLVTPFYSEKYSPVFSKYRANWNRTDAQKG